MAVQTLISRDRIAARDSVFDSRTAQCGCRPQQPLTHFLHGVHHPFK